MRQTEQPAATQQATPIERPPQKRGGQYETEIHGAAAPSPEILEATARALPSFSSPQDGEAALEADSGGAGFKPPVAEVGPEDRRFSDPLIAETVETWRMRQDMVRAQQKLTLQIKSICRRFTAGDKTEAEKLYRSMQNGQQHELALSAYAACLPLMTARVPLEEQRKAYEKSLTKLGAQLPIAHMADEIKGIGHLALAKIVGECGDLSAYATVSGVWKRAGLAVIDGGRQRRVTGEAALLHGYSPERRSVFWNIADSLLKAQGKDDTAGPYRLIYDDRKAYEIAREIPLGHAHNRAMRFMTKRLLRDLWVAWRRSGRACRDTHGSPRPTAPIRGAEMTPYDQWKLATPWDDEPEPCDCGEDDCTCAEDAALEHGDYLLEQKRDREWEDRQ